ncbi:hypothetical protein [Halomarina oriensis]|uniref:Uncharacterized protein n=1 Tax=Halomarina oriensis TaxID=671145 RepID=A0A6B0GM77_9EURY|nr:hypothetical protein [Halomarina oriensis]MWG34787.1 hypothetical protein [Halomarina oriensis]
MSSVLERLDRDDPEVRETLADLATSDRPLAPAYADMFRDWYGDEP